MKKLFDNIDLTPFCSNEDEYCKCKTCINNQINRGSCAHCFDCINGEKAMDVCESYKEI